MICENPSIRMAFRTGHFWVWALGPQTGSMSTSRLSYGSLLRANLRHLFNPIVVPKEACAIHTEGTHKIPLRRYRCFWTLSRVGTGAKTHAGTLTEWGDLHPV